MQSNLVETLIGAVVIAVAAVFLYFAYQVVDTAAADGYRVTARFDRIDGIGVGSDVRLSGIKVGTVTAVTLDPKTYLASVEMSVSKGVPLPDDSSVKIGSEGLLGGAYVHLEPGGSDTMVADGGELINTQGAIDLMGLIGRAVFGGPGEGGAESPPGTPAEGTAP